MNSLFVISLPLFVALCDELRSRWPWCPVSPLGRSTLIGACHLAWMKREISTYSPYSLVHCWICFISVRGPHGVLITDYTTIVSYSRQALANQIR
ncbi:hypothetical protein EDB83DRAFT_40884 [Lactarius deliciosus]|nr:hypothetical protein EDB83DRAFT_40884 [Lactarius deliciosus]